jgi:hypothetical protein
LYAKEVSVVAVKSFEKELRALVVLIDEYQNASVTRFEQHKKDSMRNRYIHVMLGLPVAALSAIAGISAFAQQTTAAGIVAIVVAVITGVTSFLTPGEQARVHKRLSIKYDQLATNFGLLRAMIEHELVGWPEASEEFEVLKGRFSDLTESEIP